MRPNFPLKKLFTYFILTFYNHVFGPDAYMIYGTITENDTTEQRATMTSQYTCRTHIEGQSLIEGHFPHRGPISSQIEG